MSKLKCSTTQGFSRVLTSLLVATSLLAGGCEGCGEQTDDEPEPQDTAPAEPDTSSVDMEKASEEAEKMAATVAINVTDETRYITGNVEAQNTPDEPAPTPNVRNQRREANGSIPAADLQKVFRKYSGQTQKCYERALKKNPNLAGRVLLELTIDPDGSVAAASAQGDTLRSNEVNSCLEELASGWSFPSPSGGAARVRKPYTFSPKR
jgi:hypothetical protein